MVEMVYAEEDAEGRSEADTLDYMRDAQYAYALLQADLDEGEGSFIAPTWLKAVPELAAADITQDWSEDLSAVSGEEIEAFYAWLTRQGRPSNVVDFLAERDRRRGSPASDPDIDN